MSRSGDMEGVPVSEEAVAADLGFASVHDMRRWNTELGVKVSELEAKLREVQGDADRFKWHGQRMQKVLEMASEYLRCYGNCVPPCSKEKLMLAIAVVCGKGVDWNHELDDWLKETPS